MIHYSQCAFSCKQPFPTSYIATFGILFIVIYTCITWQVVKPGVILYDVEYILHIISNMVSYWQVDAPLLVGIRAPFSSNLVKINKLFEPTTRAVPLPILA